MTFKPLDLASMSKSIHVKQVYGSNTSLGVTNKINKFVADSIRNRVRIAVRVLPGVKEREF